LGSPARADKGGFPGDRPYAYGDLSRQAVQGALERVVIGRNRRAVSSDHVNPLYTKRIDQIHTVDGSPKAIPFDRDLI
jgi:hypothetical protein